jgi:hypothetical protein
MGTIGETHAPRDEDITSNAFKIVVDIRNRTPPPPPPPLKTVKILFTN